MSEKGKILISLIILAALVIGAGYMIRITLDKAASVEESCQK